MPKYKGTFNYYQQVFELHTTAKTKLRAFANFINQLKPLTDATVSKMRWYFNGDVDNFSIKEVKDG